MLLWRKNTFKVYTFSIDLEYTMIISKLEILILYSLITPLVIPISIIAMYNAHYMYSITIYKLKWNIVNRVSMPLEFLLYTIVVQQVSMAILSVFLLNETYPVMYDYKCTITIIIFFLLIDIYYIIKYCKYTKNKNKPINTDYSYHSLDT